MIIKKVDFYFLYLLGLIKILYFNDSGFKPSSNRMIRIDSVIYLYVFSFLPLLQYSVWIQRYKSIVLCAPAGIMYINSFLLNLLYFRIHPFLNWILDINIFSNIESLGLFVVFHSSSFDYKFLTNDKSKYKFF
jgi:hypothetical protein